MNENVTLAKVLSFNNDFAFEKRQRQLLEVKIS